MRLFMINVLATAMLLTAATQASALTITQTGGGGSYLVSDTITMQYYINNIGDPGLAVIAFSVGYNSAVVSVDLVNSKLKNNILKGSLNEGSYPNTLYKGLPRLSTNPTIENGGTEALFGWSGGLSATWSEASNYLIATLVLHADAPGTSGVAPFIGAGASFAQDNGTYTTAGISFSDITGEVLFAGGNSITVVPEPTTALLIGLGLVGLGVAGSRGRQER